MNDFLNKLPRKEATIWKALELAGFQTYLVGGAVRDILLGETPKDFDIATKATPAHIANVFVDSEFKLDYVGASFGVMLVSGVEVATFRGDRYFGGGDKDVEITYVDTIEEDLSRRDFTINAMAMSSDGKLIDPFHGERDLAKFDHPVIRYVGNANDRINEDPNRILRAFRFAARFDGEFYTGTFDVLHKNADKVDMIAPERIRLEIMKTMESIEKASKFWELLRMSGVLQKIFPEMVDGFEHDHGDHHSEDVWTHNMLAGDFIEISHPLLKLAAYLHDIGKPASYDSDNGTFYEHHMMGADIIRERLTALKFSNDEIRFVVNLVLIHMDGTRGMTNKARRRLKNKLDRYDLDWEDYLAIRIADRHANLTRLDFNIAQIADYVEMFTMKESVPVDVTSLVLSGGQIINLFNLTPSPLIGKIQRELLKLVIENGDQFNTVKALVDHIMDVFDIEPDFRKVQKLTK